MTHKKESQMRLQGIPENLESAIGITLFVITFRQEYI